MKGWLDNFGKADNANNSNVSMSEDFVGLGYNTKGRNYSPAWGGQFQKGGNLFMQQTMDVVQPPATVPYLRTKDPAEFYKAWIQNPEYARRQLLTGYSSGEDLYMPNAAASRESRLGALEEMTPITYSTRQPSKASPGVYGSPSYVNINPLDYIDTSKEAIEAHELAHIAGAMGEVRPGMMSAKEQEIFKKSMLPVKEPVLSGVQGSKEREASKRALEDWKHSQEPDEAKADLDALRFMMYDKGIYDITKGKKFTEADFEKAKQSLGKDRVFKRLTDRVGKKNFVNLMNVIAKGDEDLTPIAINGASMPGAVGFTYARVAGAAPSKGKYAKKTMASAQNGIIADKIAGLELKMSPEYQRLKYLQSLPQLRQAPGRGEELVREGLATADIATDLMQVGNFIPHPIAQGVGKAGNILGSGVDLAQALISARQGDYLDAAINLGSVGLAGGLASSTFRRNSKYLQPGQPLYALSPQAFGSLSRTNYIEPFRKVGKMTDKNLLANRALLGLIGAETVYDAIPQKEYGGDIPSAQTGIMTPMLLARNVLNYFYPSEEAAPSVSAAPVEYKKGLTDELLKRQAYKESTFNPAAVSPAGYKGLTQIGESVLKDYSKKKGGKKLDPFNPKDAVELQKFAMDDLYNASFINKPDQPDSVRLAKTLAAYNWGRGNLFNYLNEQKQKGVDIYDSYDWLNDLPKETSDYVNKILLQEDESFNKNYKRDSTNPKYKDITSLYDKKKFGGKITTAQNGQEMRFYQNGLDWKPKSMQNGGEEDIKTIDLPEIVVTPYDEQYPFYQSLSEEEKKYLNDKGPIGRGIRAIATTGKRGQTAKDISSAVRDVQQTGAEFTGIPGTIRFSDDPLKNLTGTGKTLLDLAMVAPGFGNPLSAITGPLVYGLNDGINPITGEQMFSEENLQGAFDTLDALGMATGAVTFLKQPVQLGAKTAGRFLTTKTPLRNTYKINPFAVKEPDVILTRTQKPGQTAELRRLDELESKGLDNLNFMERYEYNQLVKSPASQAPGYGRGFSSDLGDIGYYADPSIQATRGYEGFPEILKMRLPATEAAKFNVAQNPLQGYISYSPKREFLLPKELVYSAESFTPTVGYGVGQAGARGPGSLSNFIRTANAEQRIANTPDWLRGYPSIANKSSTLVDNIKEARKNIVNRSITPIGYDPFTVAAAPLELITPNVLKFKPKTFATKNRFDAWRLYNGLDPEFNTFSKNPDGTLAINDFRLGKDDLEEIVNNPKESFGTTEISREFNFGGVHGNGWITKGVDEEGRKFIDFTDTWDLQPFAAFSKLPERIRNFEVSSVSGGKPFDLKNRIYYDDKGNFFDHSGNKLVEEVQHFPKGVAKENEAADIPMLSTPNVVGTKQTDVLKDWDKATQHKFIKGGLTSGIGVISGLNYLTAREKKKRLKEDKKKDGGGVVKDDNGYLNPDNFGKVVEIDSNIITMEGVNQPLLGISDTGDKKLMKPGKNYKFKGKKVTEFPVAELGINQLDAYPMKKLNQLLNFTNNPDKDNWLDKYN